MHYKLFCKFYLKYFNSQINVKRFIRKLPTKLAEKNEAESSKAIETVKNKVDLNKYSSNLSSTARLAIQNDSNLLKKISDNSIVNEKGEIEIKQLKFKFQAEDFEKLIENNNQNEIENSKKIKGVTIDDFDLEEDPNFPKSKIYCSGCGSKLHCQDKQNEGFVDARKFKILTKKELFYTLCFRCEFLKTKKKLLNLKANQFDYEKFILKKILSQPKVHVVLLIDLLDIPNSIYSGWSKLIKNTDLPNPSEIDICILGNKFDLLPNTGPLFEKSIKECLIHQCTLKGIKGDQIKHVDLISAKTGYNIEKVISKFFKLWNDEGDVYLLGMANAGKSVFFNKLLSSDYCRSLASEAILRATTSFWPGTTLNSLRFPITFLTYSKDKIRKTRLIKDQEFWYNMEDKRAKRYEKNHDLKDAEYIGFVGSSFKKFSINKDEIDANIDSTYSIDRTTGRIVESENYSDVKEIELERKEEARSIYNPDIYKNKASWFYDTPGVLDTQEILRNFSKKELEIIFANTIIIPRIYWMTPGQTLFVGGLIRIDLLESTNNERVLFSIMASPALPIVNPLKTEEAETTYKSYYEKGNILRVPHSQHIRENPLPDLEGQTFEINCVGNYKSTADIVFSCFGWAAVTSRPDTKAVVKAYTLGAKGLALREPSLLPFIVNLRTRWDRKDGSQSFRSIYYKKPKITV